jgi:hypothetical protein
MSDRPKKTSEGREERLEPFESVGILPPPARILGTATEGIIGACVAAWSAHRIATRRAALLPPTDNWTGCHDLRLYAIES